MSIANDSKSRFSNRVADYVKWRPSYPKEAVDLLFAKLGLTAEGHVADIGSGTGIFTKLLAGRVAKIYAVEPNKDMRAAAEHDLSGFQSFVSVNASAERITLPDSSVDLIVSAQAFHWFDHAACKREFARILKPSGNVALIWNRRLEDNPFAIAYEELLKNSCSEYKRVDHRNLLDSDFTAFFKNGVFKRESFPYSQALDFAGLLGRSKSSSYVPLPGSKEYESFEKGLRSLHDELNVNGLVEIPYRSEIIWGKP